MSQAGTAIDREQLPTHDTVFVLVGALDHVGPIGPVVETM